MISLTNLRSLHEASAYDMEDDYLHGIALEDIQYDINILHKFQ